MDLSILKIRELDEEIYKGDLSIFSHAKITPSAHLIAIIVSD